MDTFNLERLLASCESKEAPNYRALVDKTSPQLLLAALMFGYLRLN
jgi:hypothetical protein